MTVDDSQEAGFTVVIEDNQGPWFGARQKIG